MTKVRIGVAGANGAFGAKHLQALQAVPDAVVTAVADTSMERADAAGDSFDVKHRFDDYDALLACDEVDAVVLATPTPIHAEQAQKGVHSVLLLSAVAHLAIDWARASKLHAAYPRDRPGRGPLRDAARAHARRARIL